MSLHDDKRFIEQLRHGMSEVGDMMDSILRDEEDEEDSAVRNEWAETEAFERRIEEEQYEAAHRLSEAYRARHK